MQEEFCSFQNKMRLIDDAMRSAPISREQEKALAVAEALLQAQQEILGTPGHETGKIDMLCQKLGRIAREFASETSELRY